VVDQVGAGWQLYFGNANDTNLYRLAANQLKTDGDLYVGREMRAFQYARAWSGSANQVLIGWNNYLGADGAAIGFGSALDVTLWRQAANALRTNAVFQSLSDVYGWAGSAAEVRLTNTSGMPTVLWGGDTNLYRAGAALLKTDGHLVVGGTARGTKGASGLGFEFYADNGSPIRLRWDGTSGRLYFSIDGIADVCFIQR